MEEGPKPIILTENPKIPIQIEEKTSGDPGKNSIFIGFVLIFCSIIMFSTLDEFCCLMGLLALVGGFAFLGSGFQKTHNWRKENDNKKWTIGEILVLILLSVFLIPLVGTILEEMLWY
jgi:polyferredoxin